MGETKERPEVLERFSSGLQLVEIIARQVLRTLGGAAELDELLSFGREGLWDAARRFDDSRGVRSAVLCGMRAYSAVTQPMP